MHEQRYNPAVIFAEIRGNKPKVQGVRGDTSTFFRDIGEEPMLRESPKGEREILEREVVVVTGAAMDNGRHRFSGR